MGLFDKLRKAEEQGRGAAHRKLETTRESWDDAERRLRRQMRLHPRSGNPSAPSPEPVQPPVSSSKKEVAGHILPNPRNSEQNAA
ncbi:MAG: hypothetical protein LAO06_11440 [Acidobacteriia bacterium]|nr:hypothetical protein [Terriglobia bacterium]